MLEHWRRACLKIFDRHLKRVPRSCIAHRTFSTSISRFATAGKTVRMEDFTCDVIRLLELTGTIDKKTKGLNQQVLDKLKVERERGITVKAQTASMFHSKDGIRYLLNLIDTPGHVDFAWEVSRSLAACQGALLLVDATQGVQAQSISVFHIAQERGLTIIPVLNKIDMPAAQPDIIASQMQATFGIDPADILQISAKTGQGVENVLKAIIERIPPPVEDASAPLKAVLFDSSYDRYRGVISLLSIQNGVLKKGEVGERVEPMPGFKPAKAMVYAGVFPVDSNDFLKLEESIKRLTLTDRSVEVTRESSTALGQGCRLGFLGTLHMDVFRQRLEDEYDASVIITAPTVPYKVVYKDRTALVSNPTDFPDIADYGSKVKEIQEPVVNASIIVPQGALRAASCVPKCTNVHALFLFTQEYLGDMMDLCFSHRAENLDHRYLDSLGSSSRAILTCTLPLSEIVIDFFDKLKSRSSGFASFDYEDAGYQPSNLSKMVFLLNSKPVDALALIVHRSAEQEVGRAWVKKLHKVIPRQMFEVPIQAAIGRRIIARETLSAMRADVTAGLYGGHYERKMKHLENQKESKRKMKRIGSIDLPQEAFFDILSSKARKS
ncbi:Translation factor GUF1, mitochondrial [Grifola frondosa]|uniref:Translation factor GUF1, mitochondrial n=1 Tax=Grifola frondosa TaxID=5627 RepID=A0A1C7MFX5_GRIFR|nr:Translation factor GUF1, mitochondrial [Grifola frondosa]